MDGRVRVGCSGYSYPEWIGPFYPEGTARQELLARYAEHFDLLEVSHTYYRLPAASAMERLVRRTRGGVRFTVRLPAVLTRGGQADPAAIRSFTEALVPLREAGVLAAALAEFPRAFEARRASALHVTWLQRQLGDLPLAVELRAGGWARPRVYEWLQRRGIALCSVDQPRLPGLFPSAALATGPLAYVRFHGRNVARWGLDEDPGDRYAYRYEDAELLPWVERVGQLARRCEEVLVVFHNHRDGEAPRAALRFLEMLQQAGARS